MTMYILFSLCNLRYYDNAMLMLLGSLNSRYVFMIYPCYFFEVESLNSELTSIFDFFFQTASKYIFLALVVARCFKYFALNLAWR